MRRIFYYTPSTSTYHGGYFAKGQTWTAGERHISGGVAITVGNLSYKFVVINNIISTIIKRVSLFSQSRRNKIGIMNVKLKQLL